jgi:hypothetical protein
MVTTQTVDNFKIKHTTLAMFTMIFIISSNCASAINKCTINGKVTYTDLPCSDEAHSSKFTQQVIPPDNPAAEKKRHLANQKKLQTIEKQKIKEENQYQREARAQAQQIKKQEEHQFKCNDLDLKRRSARQHQSEVQLKRNSYATEKARLRVKQADNKYKHYCK